MKSSSALTAAKTVIRWLRWAAVLGFVYSAWSGLLYSAVQNIGFYTCPLFLFVAAGAKIAPRNRLIVVSFGSGWDWPPRSLRLFSLRWQRGCPERKIPSVVLMSVSPVHKASRPRNQGDVGPAT
jgi:hypothetical protein